MSEAADNVKRIVRGDRGFLGYGKPSTCTYGTKIEVYESSSAIAPHVWLKLQQDSNVLGEANAGEAVAHLDVKQAKKLIARLQAWLDDIPERWS